MCQSVANLSGLIGSILLAIPAIRLSNYLRTIKLVEEAAGKVDRGSDAIGSRLAAVMKGQASTWNRRDHGMLIVGFILLGLSFVLSWICPMDMLL